MALKEAIDRVLERLRPGLQADGSDVKVERIEGENIHLKLIAGAKACEECFMPADSLKTMFQTAIQNELKSPVNVILEDARKEG